MVTKLVSRFVGFFLFLFCSLYASAQVAPPGEPIGGFYGPTGSDRGRYQCNDGCEMDPAGVPISGISGAFIKGTVNSSLNGCCKNWNKGDWVTICNGTDCVTYTYIGSNQWVSQGKSSDDGNRYGDKATIKHWWSDEQYSPQCSLSGSMTGHYEWDDYYSNGDYTGSGNLQWVADGVSLNRNCA
jgi:hypothetical protein